MGFNILCYLTYYYILTDFFKIVRKIFKELVQTFELILTQIIQ